MFLLYFLNHLFSERLNHFLFTKIFIRQHPRIKININPGAEYVLTHIFQKPKHPIL